MCQNEKELELVCGNMWWCREGKKEYVMDRRSDLPTNVQLSQFHAKPL